MRKTKFGILMLLTVFAVIVFDACKKDDDNSPVTSGYPAVVAAFGDRLDLNNLENYAAQDKPGYINKDNTGANPITDKGATLGRVLFYDKKLSVNEVVSCGSCHKQEFAFGDTALRSVGANGLTGRHAMRLANARFAQEANFFWDERAASLEFQTTQPIQNHEEMGYSGQNGDQNINDLIAKLQAVDYYKELFTFVYGDEQVTEERIQKALSQFIRSIQSFDSKFDAGMAQVNNRNQDFPNFTDEENLGKRMFLTPANGAPNSDIANSGAGCQGCHSAPEFDIDPNSHNNGVTGVLGFPGQIDVANTRAPSLRNLVNIAGIPNGQFMHDGSITTLSGVIAHYNLIVLVPGNNNLDARLRRNGVPQNLGLTRDEINGLVAFLKTLSGQDLYTNKKWSDPF